MCRIEVTLQNTDKNEPSGHGLGLPSHFYVVSLLFAIYTCIIMAVIFVTEPLLSEGKCVPKLCHSVSQLPEQNYTPVTSPQTPYIATVAFCKFCEFSCILH